MRLLPTLLVLLLALAAPASAQGPADSGGPLVYTFVLDGLDGDRVDAGRAPYLSSLLAGQEGARATYFRESRSIMVAETNPNHAAMATGAYGSTSGIPGNSFAVYSPTANEDSCAPTGPVDESRPPTSVSGEDPSCVQAETFFESIQRRAGAEATVTAGIFGKPKLARIFAGKKADPARYDADYLWTPCVSPSADEPYCKQVPNRGFDEYAVLDQTVMDEVNRTVRSGVPGDGRTFTGGSRRPNLTFVNLPGIDSSGHATGATAEYDNAVGRADAAIRSFVANQKALGLWERTTMIVLSDHSMDTTPQAGSTSLEARFQRAGIPSGGFEVIQNGSAALVYLTDRTSPDRFALLKRLREAATDPMTPTPPFGPPAVEALYREANPADGGMTNTLDARHPGWRLNGTRTGDLVVTSRSGVAFNPLLLGNHGGPQTRDNFLAVIGGSDLVNQRAIASAQDPLFDDTERNPTQAENVDVAPTVLRLLGRAAPAQNQGRFLEEAFRADRLAAIPAAGGRGAGGGRSQPGACAARAGFRSASATRAGRGLRFRFSRTARAPVSVDVFQSSIGSRIVGNRLIARFTGRSRGFRWNGEARRGRTARDGYYFVRLRTRDAAGRTDTRRVTLRRSGGRFTARPAFYARESCGIVSSFKLERPVFGGRTNRALDASFRLSAGARVTVDLLRGSRVVRRVSRASDRPAGRTVRVRIGSERLRRGDHRVRLTVVQGARTTTTALTARRL